MDDRRADIAALDPDIAALDPLSFPFSTPVIPAKAGIATVPETVGEK